MYQGVVVARNGAFTAEIWRNLGGTWSLLSSAPLPVVSPQTFRGTVRLEAQGARLTLLLDTTVVARAVDFAIPAPGLFGVRGSAGMTFENFQIDRVFAIPPFADDFNRANSTNLSPNPAVPSWREEAGDLVISGGKLAGTQAVNVATYSGLSYADGYVDLAVALTASGQFAGAVARYSGPGDSNMYWGGLVNRGGLVAAEIWRNLGGAWVQLASANLGAGAGTGVIRFEVTGSSLRLFRNGSVVAAASDRLVRGPGLFGARLTRGATADDFSVTPI
jgi:hypothetical protein